jgi:hypothetical protein
MHACWGELKWIVARVAGHEGGQSCRNRIFGCVYLLLCRRPGKMLNQKAYFMTTFSFKKYSFDQDEIS